MLKKGKTYQAVCQAFQWKIPAFYNIGVDICDKWAGERYRLALLYEDDKGRTHAYTFWDLKRLSDRLANAFRAYGLEKGDRVGILLPQCPETALSHIALYKIGAVAVPLFTLFGPEALEYRLHHSGAKAVIVDEANLGKVLEIREQLPALEHLFCTRGGKTPGVTDFHEALEKGATAFKPVRTRADDPALIIYTSGTTGPPKGALHAHRVLLGHVPGVEFFFKFFPPKRRPLLDAGRLGLDRWFAGCPLPRLAPRSAGGCLSGEEIRSGRGLCPHGPLRRPKRLSPAHGLEADASSGKSAAAS